MCFRAAKVIKVTLARLDPLENRVLWASSGQKEAEEQLVSWYVECFLGHVWRIMHVSTKLFRAYRLLAQEVEANDYKNVSLK